MPDLYSIFVIVLFALAITDLVVGVSNDAVNFLISAIGAKVAPRRIIMVVAGVGVFVGATFSSGMMEVARKGIFHPDQFVFSEIMIIFLAVMITDIILLDTFNTFGLPTSTTVSIVFELLGAAVAVSLIKITGADQGVQHLGAYINSEKALAIISGILISVVVAFSVGVLVQYISRLIFTFNFKKNIKWAGVLWSAIAMAVLTHFLFVKGLKHASFIDADTAKWLKEGVISLGGLELQSIFAIDGFSFIFWGVLLLVLDRLTQINILKIVVLAGTFALAMAFAGNDLVNFIGVPIAGLESYVAFQASGLGPDEMTMEVLTNPVQTKTYLLLIAGSIMVITLWMSRKARTVTETSVNLSRQAEGQERFSPNAASRGIVKVVQAGSDIIGKLISPAARAKIQKRLTPVPLVAEDGGDPPAFDMIRASVNLTVASMLISFATSLKLPLSTTYVTFMVAMGTSLADRAWGRESAVYRVAGVISVVSGWFLTAFIAFMVSAIFASLMYAFGPVAVFGLLILAIGLITRSFLSHRNAEKDREAQKVFESDRASLSGSKVTQDTLNKVTQTLKIVGKVYDDALAGLIDEDPQMLKQARSQMKDLRKKNESFRYNLYAYIKRIQENKAESSKKYLTIYDFEQDIVNSAGTIAQACNNHVANVHKPLDKVQGTLVQDLRNHVGGYLKNLSSALEKQEFNRLEEIVKEKNAILNHLDELVNTQVNGIRSEAYSSRNSLLYFELVFQTKDLVAVAARFLKFYAREANSGTGQV